MGNAQVNFCKIRHQMGILTVYVQISFLSSLLPQSLIKLFSVVQGTDSCYLGTKIYWTLCVNKVHAYTRGTKYIYSVHSNVNDSS